MHLNLVTQNPYGIDMHNTFSCILATLSLILSLTLLCYRKKEMKKKEKRQRQRKKKLSKIKGWLKIR